MSDEDIERLRRDASTGDLNAQSKLRLERRRGGISEIFSGQTYQGLATLDDVTPPIPRGIEKYQTPCDEQAAEVNQCLVDIFNDTALHLAIRAYGKSVLFAQSIPVIFAQSKQVGVYYNRFSRLELRPKKRLVLYRTLNDPTTFGDGLKSYDLYQKDNGIFYTEALPQIFNKEQGILAANDIRGHEAFSILQGEKFLTADQIMQSLEEAVSVLLR